MDTKYKVLIGIGILIAAVQSTRHPPAQTAAVQSGNLAISQQPQDGTLPLYAVDAICKRKTARDYRALNLMEKYGGELQSAEAHLQMAIDEVAPMSFDDCVKSEQSAYNDLKKRWGKISEALRVRCKTAQLKHSKGDRDSYAMLQDCLENPDKFECTWLSTNCPP